MSFRFLLFFLISATLSFGQITGVESNKIDGKPLENVKVYASNGYRTITDANGNFELNGDQFPVTLVFVLLEYERDTLIVQAAGSYSIKLGINEKNEQTVVVSANKRAQAIE